MEEKTNLERIDELLLRITLGLLVFIGIFLLIGFFFYDIFETIIFEITHNPRLSNAIGLLMSVVIVWILLKKIWKYFLNIKEGDSK